VPKDKWLVVNDVNFDANLYAFNVSYHCSLDEVFSTADTKKISLERAVPVVFIHGSGAVGNSPSLSPAVISISSSVGVAFAPGSTLSLFCYSRDWTIRRRKITRCKADTTRIGVSTECDGIRRGSYDVS